MKSMTTTKLSAFVQVIVANSTHIAVGKLILVEQGKGSGCNVGTDAVGHNK